MHLETGRHLYGGARQVGLLLDGLTAAGCENVLVCRPGSAIANHASKVCRTVPIPMYGDFDLGLFGRIRRILQAERPDLLHVHSRNGAEEFGGRAAAAENIPSVLTRRVDSNEPRWWARRKFSRFDRIVAISSPIENWLSRGVGIDCSRLARVPSATETGRFAARDVARQALNKRFAYDNSDKVIVAVAQLIPRKGLDMLIDAFARVRELNPQTRLLICGRGPEAVQLRRQIAARDLSRHVQLPGFVDQLEHYLAGFDLLVHPARSEGLGVAVLEAMACALPIVATSVGGIGDVVSSGRTGVLVRPEDPAALAEAMNDLLNDSQHSAHLGGAAQEYVRAHHSPAVMTQAYLDIYEGLFDERANGELRLGKKQGIAG